MKNRWNTEDADRFLNSPLELRAYTSRLLGQEEDLVLHGGGNTSLKKMELGIFGGESEVLYVKGSGWDLKNIEPPGFSPCRLNYLKKLASLSSMDDMTMMKELKKSLLEPGAPAPSVEALLHAIIPLQFVDHTHADAVVTLSNTPNGPELIREIYGEDILVLPYTMPGFILSKQVYEATKKTDWKSLRGIILLHHGVFTFSDDAKESYDNMIDLVSMAEQYLKEKKAWEQMASGNETVFDSLSLSRLRKLASQKFGKPMLVGFKGDSFFSGMASLENIEEIATRGCLTPDHVIQTKRVPFIASEKEEEWEKVLEKYAQDYQQYFEKHGDNRLTCLDKVPRYGIVKNKGLITLGPNRKRQLIVEDIVRHTFKAIQWAEALGGWKALPPQDIFDLEYWELEQAKLKTAGRASLFEGRVAVVTGAASGIGKATVDSLYKAGSVVAALDIDSKIHNEYAGNPHVLGIQCDMTKTEEIQNALGKVILECGGIDIVVSNAGVFPKSSQLSELSDEQFEQSLQINLSSHQKLLRESAAFLKEGWEPSFIIVGSKNVAAPGPGAGAYSAAKAGLNQLARVAALELGEFGIRVNSVHPNAIFDTGVWSEDVLKERAEHYKMSVDEYKKNNLLKTEITSNDVANLIVNLCSPVFLKTTGAQIPIDGGNPRVV